MSIVLSSFAQRHVTGDRLSRAASAIVRLAVGHTFGREADHGFDAGEWSDAAHDWMEAEGQDSIAREHGYENRRALYYALANRTSDRWMHFSFPPMCDPAGDRFRSHYGRNR